MKKLLYLILMTSVLSIGISSFVKAQDAAKPAAAATAAPAGEESFHQTLKTKFIEGGPLYMTPILLCFIITFYRTIIH